MNAEPETSLQVKGCTWEAGHLVVECTGVWGIGSNGTPSAQCVVKSVEDWTAAQPGRVVSEITLDLSAVDYQWGDGPVVALSTLLAHGYGSRAWIRAAEGNRVALEGLVRSCNLPRIALRGTGGR